MGFHNSFEVLVRWEKIADQCHTLEDRLVIRVFFGVSNLKQLTLIYLVVNLQMYKRLYKLTFPKTNSLMHFLYTVPFSNIDVATLQLDEESLKCVHLKTSMDPIHLITVPFQLLYILQQ